MNELIDQLIQKTGITEQQARQVVAFLQAHADKVPAWLCESDPVRDVLNEFLKR